MSNYTKATDFAAKDGLTPGDPDKVVKGTEIETEFDAIATAVNSKSDSASPTFTGTVTIPTPFTIGATSMTSTAAELNILDGATVTTAELNILDGVTSAASELNLLDGSSAGTIVNSKAVIYGASGEVNATTLQVGGTSITSTPAELNLLDGSSAGTIVNSKGVIYGASGEVNATTLQIGGTSITSTAAELNLLDGSVANTVVNSKGVIYGSGGEISATSIDVTTGNITFASGQGIDFSATSDGSGTASSELFDDYEEGTFTPFIADANVNASESQTHSTQTGTYTKVGNRVFFDINLVWTGIGTLNTSQQMHIGGLPYAPAAAVSGISIANATGLDKDDGSSWVGQIDTDSAISVSAWWTDGAGAASTTEISDVKINNASYPSASAAGGIQLSGSYRV